MPKSTTPDSSTLSPAQQALADWLHGLAGTLDQQVRAQLADQQLVLPSREPLKLDQVQLPVVSHIESAAQHARAGGDPTKVADNLVHNLANTLIAMLQTEQALYAAGEHRSCLVQERCDTRRDLDSLRHRVQAHVVVVSQLTADLGETLQSISQTQAREADPVGCNSARCPFTCGCPNLR